MWWHHHDVTMTANVCHESIASWIGVPNIRNTLPLKQIKWETKESETVWQMIPLWISPFEEVHSLPQFCHNEPKKQAICTLTALQSTASFLPCREELPIFFALVHVFSADLPKSQYSVLFTRWEEGQIFHKGEPPILSFSLQWISYFFPLQQGLRLSLGISCAT